jgi:hypothetical protein
MTPEFLGALLAPEQQSNILYGAIGASVVLNLCLKSAVAVLNSYALQISKRTLSSIWQPSSAHTPMSYSQGFSTIPCVISSFERRGRAWYPFCYPKLDPKGFFRVLMLRLMLALDQYSDLKVTQPSS